MCVYVFHIEGPQSHSRAPTHLAFSEAGSHSKLSSCLALKLAQTNMTHLCTCTKTAHLSTVLHQFSLLRFPYAHLPSRFHLFPRPLSSPSLRPLALLFSRFACLSRSAFYIDGMMSEQTHLAHWFLTTTSYPLHSTIETCELDSMNAAFFT